MPIVAMLNQKGGVGKTTSALNLGAGLSKLGKKVLLVDLDPQANLTYSLNIQAHKINLSIYDLLKGETTFNEVLIERDGLKVVPSNLDLSGAEIEFSAIPGREFLLKEAMEGNNSFDYIFIDCPPSLGLLSLNALTTVSEVFIPLQTEYLPMQGMAKLLQTIEVVKKRLNNNLDITGIICTRFDGRKRLNREVVSRIKEHFGSKVFGTCIRENISLAEAPSFGKTIFEYKPDSHGAEDYLRLSKEIIKRKNR
jgi:chromosome partitioning protein